MCIRDRYDIDYVWIIDEDGILIRSGKEYKVEKGDVVLLMYRIGNEKEGYAVYF